MRFLVLLVSLGLATAAETQSIPQDAQFALDNLPDVMPVRETGVLNVSVVLFDAGVPEDLSKHRDLQVFPRIREVEARFLPFVLRDTLANSGDWAAVRVIPETDPAAELLISAEILKSDGAVMVLQVKALDASGKVWFDKSFSGSDAAGGYENLFSTIGRELRQVRDGMDSRELAAIPDVSLLRYATRLAPKAFDGYLEKSRDGRYEVVRLPAKNDPMLQRIERIRGVEYVITDAVDLKYQELHEEIESVYEVWREHRQKYGQYQQEDQRRAQNPSLDASRGSYDALQNLYDNYKFHRITVQEQDQLAVAFNNEVGPQVDAIETRVAELDGWVKDKYAQWNRLLEELYEVESGLQ
jgi:hypothetical protein